MNTGSTQTVVVGAKGSAARALRRGANREKRQLQVVLVVHFLVETRSRDVDITSS